MTSETMAGGRKPVARLYVAGPMTGLPDFNYPAFYKAAESLREAGYEVENPADNQPEGTASRLAYMRMSLVQISKVDGIALLPGHEGSRGARLEDQLGRDLGLPVRPLSSWLPTCPECAQGKTRNCVGQAVHPVTDDLVDCGGAR